MGRYGSWRHSADETGWYQEIAKFAIALEEITRSVDNFLSELENFQTIDFDQVLLVRKKFNDLLNELENHKEKVLELVIPFVQPRLSEDEQHIFQQLRKIYSKQEHRALILSRTWASLTESASKEVNNQVLYNLRMLKSHFDVFQTISAVSFQEEVQTAMWLVRVHCTESEWFANGEMGLKPKKSSNRTALCSCKPTSVYSSNVAYK